MRRHPDFGRPLPNNSIGNIAATAIAMLLGIVVVGIFLGMVLAFLFASSAKAHEWYPPVCCSGGDCGPVDSSRITRDGADYVIDHRWRVQRSATQPSPDGQFHGCWPDKDKPPVCVFAPPDGM
jgi:hypothetical protein